MFLLELHNHNEILNEHSSDVKEGDGGGGGWDGGVSLRWAVKDGNAT